MRRLLAVTGVVGLTLLGCGSTTSSTTSGSAGPGLTTGSTTAMQTTVAAATPQHTTAPRPSHAVGVTVGAAVITPNPAVRVVFHATEFLQLTSRDGKLVVSRSRDGREWSEPTITAVRLTLVTAAAADGARIYVAGYAPGDQPVSLLAAVSDDDGATWSTQSLDTTGLTDVTFGSLAAVAAGGGTAVAMGASYSTVVDWRWTDGAWARVDPGLTTNEGVANVVVGPSGFVTVAASDNDPGTVQVFQSSDGLSWTGSPLPTAFPTPPFLAGGAQGYVMIGDDVLYHSLDAVTWTEVHRFDDLDLNVMGFLSNYPPAGGGTGFAIAFSDPDPATNVRPRVLWSLDGIDWQELRLEDGYDDAIVAVSNDVVLVLPSVIDPSLAQERPSFDDDETFAAAIADTFYDVAQVPSDTRAPVWRPSVTAAEALCIGHTLIERLGHERVAQLGFGVRPWHLLGYALSAGPFERADAETVVDTFRTCSPTWELLMITSVTEGADRISSDSADCVAAAIPDDESRELFIGQLDRDFLTEPGNTNLQRLASFYEGCLTADELDRLDWN